MGSGPSMLQLMEFSVIFKIALILCLLPVVCEHLFDCDQPLCLSFGACVELQQQMLIEAMMMLPP